MPPKKAFFWSLAPFLLSLLVYSNGLQNDLVWDDRITLVHNEFVKNPENLKKILSLNYFTAVLPVENGARPVWIASVFLDRLLFGHANWGHHLTNLLIHGANASLVFFLAFRLKPHLPFALLAGALFALHPVHTEAVNVITFRSDLLALLFTLLGFFSFTRRRLFPLSYLFYLLGLLSKESAAILPGLLLLHDWIYRPDSIQKNLKRYFSFYLPFFACLLFYLHFRAPRSGYRLEPSAWSFHAWTQTAHAQEIRPSAKSYHPSPPPWTETHQRPWKNFLTMSEIFGQYLGLLIFPHPLQMDRAPPESISLKSGRLWLSWLTWLLWLGIGALALRKHLPGAFGIFWLPLGLAPVANLLPLYNLMAERYLYLPSVGFFLAISYGWTQIPGSKIAKAGLAKAGLALLALLPLGVKTYHHNSIWKNEEALFSYSARINPKSPRTHYDLGYWHQKQGNPAWAETEYQRAIQLNPNYVEAHTNLGAVYESQGKQKQALEQYRQAVALRPTQPIPYNLLGQLYYRRKDYAKAVRAYEKAIEKDYDFAEAHMNKGLTLIAQGKKKEGLRAMQEATFVNPQFSQAHYNLGIVHESQGNPEKAIRHLERAIELEPKNAGYLINLAVLHDQLGKPAKAIPLLEKAVQADPGLASAYYNLGSVYHNLSRLRQAKENLETAVQLAPDYYDALYTLGVVLQKLNKNEEAIRIYERARKIEPRRIEVLNNLGGLYEQAGDLKNALGILTEALRLDPTVPSLYNNLGNVYLKQGKIAEAIQTYQKTLQYAEIHEDPPHTLAPTYTNLGICYQKAGRAREAFQLWQKAIESNPHYLSAYYHLARTLQEQGKDRLAQNVWRQVLALDPQNSIARKALRNP